MARRRVNARGYIYRTLAHIPELLFQAHRTEVHHLLPCHVE